MIIIKNITRRLFMKQETKNTLNDVGSVAWKITKIMIRIILLVSFAPFILLGLFFGVITISMLGSLADKYHI